MMARLGYLFQSVSILVVFFAALACASGDTEATGDASTIYGGSGTGGSGSGGTTVTASGGQMEGTAQAGSGSGGTIVGSGGTEVQPSCPNNVKEDGEKCDGTDLAGESCISLGYAGGGTLACTADCQNYDTTMCVTETVGDSGVDAADGYGG